MALSLIKTFQVPESELLRCKADLVIAASGYEARSVHCCESLKLGDRNELLIFGFKDRLTLQREMNDQFFRVQHANLIEMEGDSCLEIATQVLQRIDAMPKDDVKIVVDYSCMTRSWYAGIIQAIKNVATKRRVECTFCYSPARFTPPEPAFPNAVVGPIPGFCSLDVPDKPTALVIGLGYERDRALGLLEYVDPAVVFVFYTDPAFDPAFRDMVVTNNMPVMRQVPIEHIYKHPIGDLQRTGDLLLSLYDGLRGENRVILAPLGIKPFSLLCMLLAAQHDDVDLWRVSSGVKGVAQERIALGPVLSLVTIFERVI